MLKSAVLEVTSMVVISKAELQWPRETDEGSLTQEQIHHLCDRVLESRLATGGEQSMGRVLRWV